MSDKWEFKHPIQTPMKTYDLTHGHEFLKYILCQLTFALKGLTLTLTQLS